MTISELVAALNKVASVAGDIPVVLKHLESDESTEIKALVMAFDPAAGSANSSVTVAHAPATPAPVSEPVSAPVDSEQSS